MRNPAVFLCLVLVVLVCGCEDFESPVASTANQAIEAKDPTKCEDLENLNDRDRCFEKVGVGLNSSRSCGYIKNASRETGCYGAVAVEARSFEACEQIDKMLERLKCMSKVMGAKGMDKVEELTDDEGKAPEDKGPAPIMKNSRGEEIRITEIDGTIYVMDAAGVVRKAQEGDVLRDGDRIFPDEDSAAKLEGTLDPYSGAPDPQIVFGGREYYFTSKQDKPEEKESEDGPGIFESIRQAFTGTTLPKPPPPPKPIKPSEITITSVEGDVRIVNMDGTSVPAKVGMKVGSKQALIVMDDSLANFEVVTTYPDEVRRDSRSLLDNAAIYGTDWPKQTGNGEFNAVTGVR